MKINLIHHIAVITNDRDKALAFYVDALGFKIIREIPRPEKQDIKIDLAINQTTELELFVKDAPKRLSNPEAQGLRHIAFKVDDIEECRKELLSKNVRCDDYRIDSNNNQKLFFCYDPFGLPIEIHE